MAPIYGQDISVLFLDGPARLQSRIGDIAVAVKPGYCAYDRSATRDNVVNTPIPFVDSVTGAHDGLGTLEGATLDHRHMGQGRRGETE